MKIVKRVSTALAALVAFIAMTNYNAKTVAAANVKDALQKSGIKNTGDMSGIYSDLNGIVFFIMAIGGFWIIGMLIWGGMTLSSSGGNPQQRNAGFARLALTLLGAWVIFKAYDIAGWATGLGAAK